MSIGIFDSGLGGVTALNVIKEDYKNKDIVFYGDTCHLPYGDKSKEQIIGYSREIVEYLINKGVEVIVIACNSATSNALDILKEEYNIPIIGVIDPAIKKLLKIGSKKVGIIATETTIKSNKYHDNIKKVNKDSFVSYGRHYTLPADSTYAVLPIGYADGLKKYLSKGGYVLINNHRCEIIGNICMDMTMIRIPKEIENSIKIGDEVTVINANILDNLNIPELCVWEFMTGIGKRVKRIIV